MQTDLEQLVIQAQDGDLRAFDDLVRRFQDMAVGYAYGQIGDFHLAEDVAQDAFIGAFQELDALRDPKAFPGWFRQIVFARCSRYIRQMKPSVSLDVIAELSGGVPDPVAAMESRDMKRDVLDAIQSLPKEERLAITMFYMGGYAHRDIAAFLDVSEETVNNRLRAARRTLKRSLLTMAKRNLQKEAPSNNDDFVSAVGLCNAARIGNLEMVKDIVSQNEMLAYMVAERGYQAIHYAAQEGHTDVVAFLLDAGANPYKGTYLERATAMQMARLNGHAEVVQVIEDWQVKRSGATDVGERLCVAVRQDDLETVRDILSEDGEAVHAVDRNGNTALHAAVGTKNVSLILEILDRGADVDRKNVEGMRPIHLTLRTWPKRGVDPVEDLRPWYVIRGLLLARGAVYDLWTASAMGDVRQVRSILEMDPEAANDRERPEYFPGRSAYPIIAAAQNGHLEIVQMLLDARADPNTPFDVYEGYHVAEHGHALHHACGNNDYEMAKLLLERGTDPNTVIDASGNALDRALSHRNDQLVKLLFQYGAAPGYDGKLKPGFFAQHTDDITAEVVMLNMKPELAREILGSALSGGHPELVTLCLAQDLEWDKQAQMNCLDAAARMWRLRMPSNPGQAKAEDFYTCFEMLLKHGFDPNVQTPEGITSLHQLATLRRITVSEEDRIVFSGMLLDHGASLDVVGSEFQSTPLGLAVRNQWFSLAAFLLEKGADPNLGGTPETTPLKWLENVSDNANMRKRGLTKGEYTVETFREVLVKYGAKA